MIAPSTIRVWLSRIVILLIAAAAGRLLEWAHWPLPWILGPMLATAACAVGGLPVFAPQSARRVGQWVVGTAIGLGLTADVAGKLLEWLPIMVATSAVSVAICAILSRPFARLAHLDDKTAFFAMMPGGLAEMANIGQSVGAAPEPIALSQTVRLALIVCVLPPLVTALGYHGDLIHERAMGVLEWPGLALALGCGAVGVAIAFAVRLNNPWMIGAVLGAGLLAASERIHGSMPYLLCVAGQFLIGIAIGARLRRDVLRRLFRVGWLTALFVVVISAILYGLGLALARLTGLNGGSAVLAVSAGGIAEMTLTAQSLHLDVALVAAFHFVRAVVVNGFAAHVWSGIERLAARR